MFHVAARDFFFWTSFCRAAWTWLNWGCLSIKGSLWLLPQHLQRLQVLCLVNQTCLKPQTDRFWAIGRVLSQQINKTVFSFWCEFNYWNAILKLRFRFSPTAEWTHSYSSRPRQNTFFSAGTGIFLFLFFTKNFWGAPFLTPANSAYLHVYINFV